jgi:hypothetical protein
MSATLRIGMTDESKRVIERHQGRAAQLLAALSAGVDRGLRETAAYIMANKFRAYTAGQRGVVNGVAGMRSRSLRDSIDSVMTDDLAGNVGVRKGPAIKYARMQLGADATTIKPVSAKWLWIPVGKNLNPSGETRKSPTEALEEKLADGGRALQLLIGPGGEGVAFMRTGGKYQRGEKRGQTKGYVAFVLKKSVTVQGSDALAQGVQESAPRIRQILQEKIDEVRKS